MAVNKVEAFGETLIDLTGDTVTAAALLKGYTAHDKAGNSITGTYENTIPSGYIKPTGNLTDSLITRSSNIDSGHKATLPAGYYVNSALSISEWKSGIITGSGSSGGAFTVPYNSIGFIPSYAVLVALEPNNSSLANTVLAAFGNGASAYSAIYMYTGSKASLSTAYPINSTYNTVKLNSSGITFPGLSGVKYGTCNYRWFALR